MSQGYEDPFAAPAAGQLTALAGKTPDDYVTSMRVAPNQDAPNLTVRASTAVELADKVGALEATDLGARLGNVHSMLKAQYAAAMGLDAVATQGPAAGQQSYQQPNGAQNGAQTPQGGYQQPQQGYQQPQGNPADLPPGPAPHCPHGEKNWVKPGISKTSGKAYSGFWGCPAPQAAPDKCRPEWPKR